MDSRGELNDEQFVRRHVPRQHARADPGVRRVDAARLIAGRAPRARLRVGRLTLDIGKRRLISRNRFRNTVSTFTGVDWQWQGAAGQNARAFYLIPMRILPDHVRRAARRRVRARSRAARQRGLGRLLPVPEDRARRHRRGLRLRLRRRGHRCRPLPRFLDIWSRRHARVPRRRERPRGTTRSRPCCRPATRAAASPACSARDLDHRAHLLHFEVGYQFDARVGAEPDVPVRRRERRRGSARRAQRALQHAVRRPAIRIHDRRASMARSIAATCDAHGLRAHVRRRTRACKACCTTARFGSPPSATPGSASARATRPGAPATRWAASSKGRSRGPRSRTGSRSRRLRAPLVRPLRATQTGVAVNGDPTYSTSWRPRASERVDWKTPALREEA